jgi:putative heme-binding domain-containing protein
MAAEYPHLNVERDLILSQVDSTDESLQLAALLAASARSLWRDDDYLSFAARTSSRKSLQLVARILAANTTWDDFSQALGDKSPQVRLAAVQAVGLRLTTPTVEAAKRLARPYTYNNCRHEITYVDETIDLRKRGPVGWFTSADFARAAPSSRDVGYLKQMLADQDDAVRFQAAHYLELLQDVGTMAAVRRVWLEADAKRLADRPSQPIATAMVLNLAQGEGEELQQDAVDGRLRTMSSEAIAGNYRLRLRYVSPVGQPVQVDVDPPRKVDVVVNDETGFALDGRTIAYFEPGTNDVTLTLDDVTSLSEARISLKTLAPVVAGVPPRLKPADAEHQKAPLDPSLESWSAAISDTALKTAVAGASAERGRMLFGRDGVGCVRCHAIVDGGRGRGGPSLRAAGSRFPLRHLAESIVSPSKVVQPEFRRTVLALDDGRIVRGLITDDRESDLELLIDDGRRVTLEKQHIEERASDTASPMPTGLARTRQDLLDLLAYLSSKKPQAP